MIDAGADIVNDIWALRWQDAADPLDGREVVAVMRDTTERKLQEEALREAHLALDTAVLGIALISLDGRIRTVDLSDPPKTFT